MSDKERIAELEEELQDLRPIARLVLEQEAQIDRLLAELEATRTLLEEKTNE